uniref:E3 ligase n=1 Tax=Chionoecetes opilio bacilliform virus TaxID=1825681 RepID=A0A1Q3DL79_9VIRU|nr:E3 ligase [Chionoecetes opilio bacilliform virus]
MSFQDIKKQIISFFLFHPFVLYTYCNGSMLWTLLCESARDDVVAFLLALGGGKFIPPCGAPFRRDGNSLVMGHLPPCNLYHLASSPFNYSWGGFEQLLSIPNNKTGDNFFHYHCSRPMLERSRSHDMLRWLAKTRKLKECDFEVPNVNHKNRRNQTPLYEAIISRDSWAVKYLIDWFGATWYEHIGYILPDGEYKCEMTYIDLAQHVNSPECIKVLKTAMSNYNISSNVTPDIEMVCSICKETEAESNKDWYKLKCRHFLHCDCLISMLAVSTTSTCPECRSGLGNTIISRMPPTVYRELVEEDELETDEVTTTVTGAIGTTTVTGAIGTTTVTGATTATTGTTTGTTGLSSDTNEQATTGLSSDTNDTNEQATTGLSSDTNDTNEQATTGLSSDTNDTNEQATTGPSSDTNEQATTGPSSDTNEQASGPSSDTNEQASGPSSDTNEQASGPSSDTNEQASGPSSDTNEQATGPSSDTATGWSFEVAGHSNTIFEATGSSSLYVLNRGEPRLGTDNTRGVFTEMDRLWVRDLNTNTIQDDLMGITTTIARRAVVAVMSPEDISNWDNRIVNILAVITSIAVNRVHMKVCKSDIDTTRSSFITPLSHSIFNECATRCILHYDAGVFEFLRIQKHDLNMLRLSLQEAGLECFNVVELFKMVNYLHESLLGGLKKTSDRKKFARDVGKRTADMCNGSTNIHGETIHIASAMLKKFSKTVSEWVELLIQEHTHQTELMKIRNDMSRGGWSNFPNIVLLERSIRAKSNWLNIREKHRNNRYKHSMEKINIVSFMNSTYGVCKVGVDNLLNIVVYVCQGLL